MKNNEPINIYGDGEQIRDFIYVEDIANICIKAINSNVENEIINFSTNKGAVANAALNFLERGWNGENFHEVTENLRSSDPYMVMADFKDYRRAQADLQRLYADREQWAKMSLKNIANSGIFSADRAVLDYARDIWHASAVK